LETAEVEIDFLGCTEFFDESLFIISTLLGLPRIPKWQRDGSASPPYRGDLDPAIIRDLEKLLEVDIALYQLCRERFLDRYGDMVSYSRANVGSLELKAKIDNLQPVLVEENYKGFNLVSYDGVYGIPPAAGAFDIERVHKNGYPLIFHAATVDEVKARIDNLQPTPHRGEDMV
jgi:hypothetical protein